MQRKIVVPKDVELLATAAVDAAFQVHSELGPGLLEAAYEECLAHELRLREIRHQRQLPVPVHYKGIRVEVGFRADVVLDQKLILELKTVEQVAPIHRAQIITYLQLMDLPLGLLINFNSVLIRDGIERVLNLRWSAAG